MNRENRFSMHLPKLPEEINKSKESIKYNDGLVIKINYKNLPFLLLWYFGSSNIFAMPVGKRKGTYMGMFNVSAKKL